MEKKLVSYCLFTYNQEDYILAAIEGAIKQTYSPLEIVISDDGSKDNTFKLIEDFKQNYAGPHKIVINQNQTNLGIGAHVSKVLGSFANGDYMILLGGDDISKENHVEKAVSYIEQHSDVAMVDFNAEIINSKGEIIRRHQDLSFETKRYTLNDYIQFKPILSFAPGRIFDRSVLDAFDPISKNCPTEDSVLVLRSLYIRGLLRVNEDVLYYRIHDNNISNSGNISKLSQLAVISQYMTDVIKLFNDKKLEENLAAILLDRIATEYKIRKMRYFKYTNIVHKIIGFLNYRITIFLLRAKSKFNYQNNI